MTLSQALHTRARVYGGNVILSTLPKREERQERKNVKVVSSAEPFHRTKLIPNRLR